MKASPAALAVLAGASLVPLVPACHKDPVVTTRAVTLHAPAACAAGVPVLDDKAFGVYLALGDFDPPAPERGHLLGDLGAELPEIDPLARALLVDATEGVRTWQASTTVPASGGIDALLLPSRTSCSLAAALGVRPGVVLAPIDGQRVLVVGGVANPAPPTLVVHLDTGLVETLERDLLTPRVRASVTAFGAGALVAGGVDARGGSTALDTAEIYDPAMGGFDQPERINLSTPRADAGAVVLATGETLLVGGVGADGKTPLGSMEIVDPATRRVRSESVASLAVARRSPTVLRLASGEILVAGGVDADGQAITTIEWFTPDASRSPRRSQDLVVGAKRAFVALEGGGALAVVAPPADASGPFQNTWRIDPNGALEPAAPIVGALTAPVLFGGAGGAPALWTGDRWLRWQPWTGSFGALGALDDVPAQIGPATGAPDPGLALWLDPSNQRLTAMRFDPRGVYSPLPGALLASDTEETAPDRLVAPALLAFDAATGLTLAAGASAFVSDRTYADVDVQVDAPAGQPAWVVLRDTLGSELEVGGVGCPGAAVAGPPSSLEVRRRGSTVMWTRTSTGSPDPPAAGTCTATLGASARVSIGVRGAASGTSVARNLRVARSGAP